MTDVPKPPTPRWVQVFVIVALIVGLLIVILMIARGGRHGPGRHKLSNAASVQTSIVVRS